MSENKMIGYYDCSLGSFFSSTNNRKMGGKLSSDSSDESHDARIIILAEEVLDSENTENIVTLQIRPHNIAAYEQALLILSRVNEDGEYFPVHIQNISLINTSTPEEVEIGESKLCNGDEDRELKIEIKGGERVLGECALTLNELLERNNNFNWFPLRLPNGMDPEDSRLEIKASFREKSTFLDYITGGTPIHLAVAIDFTESNGDTKDPESLHYIGGDEGDGNAYQQAIRSVGTILEQYDSDKKIPVYGFGAKFNGRLSHAYPLNDDFKNPKVRGIDGVMEVYKKTMDNVELYHPTSFSPIIKKTTGMIESEIEINKDVYYILLIITDGVITDMETTIRSIVRAKELPLSIIIVGVGDEDFTNMKVLDADNEPLVMQPNNSLPGYIKGKDIVQFVAMREINSEELAKEVMKEIPNQFMSYMKDMKEIGF